MKAPQQLRAADPPTVLHIRRLPTGWSRRHLADRFMWLDGAEEWRRPFMEEKTTGT